MNNTSGPNKLEEIVSEVVEETHFENRSNSKLYALIAIVGPSFPENELISHK